MGLGNAIERIRNKPEHIRMRYVWGAVALCMFFVILVWIFSLRVNFANTINTPSGPINEVREQFGDLGLPANDPTRPSINDLISPQSDIADEFQNNNNQNSQNRAAPNAGPDPTVKSREDLQAEENGTVQGSSKRVPADVLPTF